MVGRGRKINELSFEGSKFLDGNLWNISTSCRQHTYLKIDHWVPRLVRWSLPSPSAYHLTLTACKCTRGLAMCNAIIAEAIRRGKMMKWKAVLYELFLLYITLSQVRNSYVDVREKAENLRLEASVLNAFLFKWRAKENKKTQPNPHDLLSFCPTYTNDYFGPCSILQS